MLKQHPVISGKLIRKVSKDVVEKYLNLQTCNTVIKLKHLYDINYTLPHDTWYLKTVKRGCFNKHLSVNESE